MEKLEMLSTILEDCNNLYELDYNEYYDKKINCLNCKQNCVFAAMSRIEEIKNILDKDRMNISCIFQCLAHRCDNFKIIERGKDDNRITTKSK